MREWIFITVLTNAVMSHDIGSFFQNVLLVSRLPWVIVVNDIGHSVFISTVRHDADMSFKDHDITALPLFRFGNIGGQFDRIAGEKHFQVPYPAKVYIFIRRCNSIFFGMLPNVHIYQSLQIIPCIFQGICSHIRTDSIAVVGITGLIIAAFVFWMCAHIGQCTVQDIQLVIYTITVCVCNAVQLRDPARKLILRSGSRSVLITA